MNARTVLALMLSVASQSSFGQAPVKKSVLTPEGGKVNTKISPVFHMNQPVYPFTLSTITGVGISLAARNSTEGPLPEVQRRRSAFSVVKSPQRGDQHIQSFLAGEDINEIYVPEGTYDLEFGGSRYFTSDSSNATQLPVEEVVGPLRLRIDARNGRHYYLFAPDKSVLPRSAAIDIPETPEEKKSLDPAGGVRKHGLYGVLKVCGFSSDHVLTPEEEGDARRSANATCDSLDPKVVTPHMKLEGTPPLVH